MRLAANLPNSARFAGDRGDERDNSWSSRLAPFFVGDESVGVERFCAPPLASDGETGGIFPPSRTSQRALYDVTRFKAASGSVLPLNVESTFTYSHNAPYSVRTTP